MNQLVFIICFLIFSCCKSCSFHGHLEKIDNVYQCVCMSGWNGKFCENSEKNLLFRQLQIPSSQSHLSDYNESQFYDWKEIGLQRRIDKLYNLAPNQNSQLDSLFPETNSSLNIENLPADWISLRQFTMSSIPFSNSDLSIYEIKQGTLRNCYLFAALASFINYKEGQNYIKNMFVYSDKASNIYVTKWFLFGRYIYVSVNDLVPSFKDDNKVVLYGAQMPDNGYFWAAIIEKSWAKIWGSYKAITDMTEDLFLSAIIGSPIKHTIDIYELFPQNLTLDVIDSNDVSTDTLKFWSIINKYASFDPTMLQNYNSFLLLGKTGLNLNYLISDHIFSIFKIYVEQDPKETQMAFMMYNPWGTDVPDNMIQKESIDKIKKMKGLPNDHEEDGQFLLSYDDILNNFDRITAYEPQQNYELVMKEINLLNGLETNITITFNQHPNVASLNPRSNYTCFFFNLLNNDFLSDQISPYIVSNLKIYPKPAEFKLYFDSDDLHSKNEFDMTYKGGYYNNANGVVNYQLSFLVKKFNYDVENKIYLSFYAPKQSLQFVNITLSQNENYPCPNNCSGHGICRTNVCQCVNEFYGLACNLNAKNIRPNQACSCNASVSYCLSSGKCKCLPGYDDSQNCESCSDQDLSDELISKLYFRQMKKDLINDAKKVREAADNQKQEADKKQQKDLIDDAKKAHESANKKLEADKNNKKRILKDDPKADPKADHTNNGNGHAYGKCQIMKNMCSNNEIWNRCKKTCNVGNCFVPAAQTACQINACYGHGKCTYKGICNPCYTNFTGTYCEILIK